MSETSRSERLGILCFGAGAIGTYIGGSLAASGNDVVFLERPKMADAIRESGLRLQLADDSLIEVAEPVIVESLGEAFELGEYDLCILAVKSYDTGSIIKLLEPFRDQLPPTLCFQNGVENEIALEELLGKDGLIPGTITSAVGKRGPGSIFVQKLRGVAVSTEHELVPRLIEKMNAAGLKAEYIENPAAMKWSKMLTNLISNASSAILDLTPGEIFSDQGLFRLEAEQLRETLRVMKAMNVPVVNLPGTPVVLLAAVYKFFPVFLSRLFVKQAVGKGRGDKMPSFHIDLHSGNNKSEVDYLNGAVVRFGRRLGIDTPVNAFFNDVLQKLVSGDLPLDFYAKKPQKLLRVYSGCVLETENNEDDE